MSGPSNNAEREASTSSVHSSKVHRINWAALLLFLPTRTILLVVGQSLFAAGYFFKERPSSWSAAGAWWTVWGTLADLGCIAILLVLTRREGIRVRDLVGAANRRTIPAGLITFFIVFPISVLGTLSSSLIFYHTLQAPMPVGEVIARHLPLWAKLYSIFVFATVWAPTEELTYNAYLATRVALASNQRWASFVLVGFWWAAQHCFLPLVLGWRFIVWRFVAFVPGVLALMGVYARTRKLAPLIFAHWIMDMIGAITTLSW